MPLSLFLCHFLRTKVFIEKRNWELCFFFIAYPSNLHLKIVEQKFLNLRDMQFHSSKAITSGIWLFTILEVEFFFEIHQKNARRTKCCQWSAAYTTVFYLTPTPNQNLSLPSQCQTKNLPFYKSIKKNCINSSPYMDISSTLQVTSY